MIWPIVQLFSLLVLVTSCLAAGWFKARIAIMHQRPTEFTPENLAILEWLVKAIDATEAPWFVRPFYWLRLGRLRAPK